MNIKETYNKQVIKGLKEKFGYKNVNQVPKILKVSINVGVGKHSKEASYIENVEKTLSDITGQKPVRTKAKKAISNFKIREGNIVGVTVTLRKDKMWDFLEKLVKISLPRIRDFRGLSTRIIDNKGNMTIGFKESSAFPEVRADEIEKIHGLEVTIVTSSNTKEEGVEMFRLLGFPFKEEDKKSNK